MLSDVAFDGKSEEPTDSENIIKSMETNINGKF